MEKKIAVLIDSENVSAKYIRYIIDELSKYGTTTYKRIYGDWTDTRAESWKKVLLDYAITPMQQYSYTIGKNSSDSAMIIDAMDILYSKSVDGFCIVSSDSDFTKLATRLREAGMMVLGMGEKKTPSAFTTACEKFLYLELLMPKKVEKPKTNKAAKDKTTDKAQGKIKDEEKVKEDDKPKATDKAEVIEILINIIEDISDENGWAYLGEVFNILAKRLPDFDVRMYNFKKPSAFVKSLPEFEVEARAMKGSSADSLFVKAKKE